MRLILSRPPSDETISSIVDRACSLYNLSRAALIEELCPGLRIRLSDIDLDVSPPPAIVAKLAEALEMDPMQLESLRLGTPAWRLIPKARIACCPKCLTEDVRTGRDPYFRADWSWCFMTHCTKHKCPLEVWSHITERLGERHWYRFHLAKGVESSPVPDYYDKTRPFTSIGRINWEDAITKRVWRAITEHERKLLSLMQSYDTAHLSIQWRIRRLYILAAGKWSGAFHVPLMNQFTPTGSPERLFNLPPHRLTPGKGVADSWKRFRSIPVPGYRRSAVWIVSQLRSPGPPASLKWFPDAGRSRRRHWMKHLVWECLIESGRPLFLEAFSEDRKYQEPNRGISRGLTQKAIRADQHRAA